MISPRVKVDNEGSEEFTILEVHCEDRLGLLYELGETFFSLGLNIRLAKIATSLKMASDSFYLEKVGSGKITDPDELLELKSRVLISLK